MPDEENYDPEYIRKELATALEPKPGVVTDMTDSKSTATPRPVVLPLPADLTHYEALICMWLGSDPTLLTRARDWFDPHPDDNATEYNAVQLGCWVCDVLYDVQYGAIHGRTPDLFWVTDLGGDVSKARAARSAVPEEHLLDINDEGWGRIGLALIAEGA